MKHFGHGETVTNVSGPQGPVSQGFAAQNLGPEKKIERFDYMFSNWSAADRLDSDSVTLEKLKLLGSVMKDAGVDSSDSGIPAGYTYFGQFVDHDITLDQTSATLAQLNDRNLKPLTNLDNLRNGRTAATELDSVYFLGVPREQNNKDRLRLSAVTNLLGKTVPTLRPPEKKDLNDLPRQSRSTEKDEDRAAIIGDSRNDENTIVAQLHTAFLKAHNTLVDGGLTFDQARTEMILRYQSVILDDFLKRICHQSIYDEVRANGPTFWKVTNRESLFMPVEFAFAAYRFGHSMVRTNYNFNLNFNSSGAPGTVSASLALLFTFTALSGNLNPGDGPGTDTLPENWIIEWDRLLPVNGGNNSVQMANTIDVRLTNFLFDLRDTFGKKEKGELAPRLATRNLLRGFLVGLPTGQAVARRLGITPLTGQTLLDALPTQDLKDAAQPFKDRSPLWFYILAEAGSLEGGKGKSLGMVGSTIVMETFYNLIMHSETSILREENPKNFHSTLSDIVMLAAKQDA